jgi:hypothetical protein
MGGDATSVAYLANLGQYHLEMFFKNQNKQMFNLKELVKKITVQPFRRIFVLRLGFKLLSSRIHSSFAFQIAGITGMHHCAWLLTLIGT